MGKSNVKLDARTVDISAVHENTWNPNRQSDKAFEAEKQSIEAFGFIDPVTVRVHPKIKGEFEIVDGAHRIRALRELGYEEVAVNVIDVTEDEAKRLTIILNETRGTPDRIDLAVLLVDIKESIGLDDLKIGLPYTDDELEGLLKLPDFDFNQFKKDEPPVDDPDDEWKTIGVRVPVAVVELWEQARENIETENSIEPHEKEQVRNGLALEAIVANYLAS